ncbi:MAG: glutathione S-transferase [Planctomycetota bacterium]|jgi:glutathione S-transferase
MYKLFWAPNSGAFAPQILLEEAGAKYELVKLDLDQGDQHNADFLAINPRGQVPALQLDDGSILTESAAIMIHLADCHADAGLLPPAGSSQRAQVYRWLIFAVANIYEADLRVFYSDLYTSDSNCVESIKQRGREDLDAAWDLLETELGKGPYLLGDRYSIIDPYLLMLTGWHEQPAQLMARCPGLARLCESVKARKAVQLIWSQNVPDA